jgi:hypothetical protein
MAKAPFEKIVGIAPKEEVDAHGCSKKERF